VNIARDSIYTAHTAYEKNITQDESWRHVTDSSVQRYPRRNYRANINLLRHLSKERGLINSGFKFDGNVEKAASLQRSEMFIDTGSLKHLAPLGAKHRKVLVDQPKHRAPTERLGNRALSGYKHLALTGRSQMCNLLHFQIEFANCKRQMKKDQCSIRKDEYPPDGSRLISST